MSKKNTTKKGNRIEAELDNYLKGLGFLTCRAQKKVLWIGPGRPISKQVDHFGCFDNITKHPKIRKFWFLFQVSTNWKYGKDLQALVDFPAGLGDYVFMVRRQDRKPFEFRFLSSLGHAGGVPPPEFTKERFEQFIQQKIKEGSQ